MTPSTHAHTLQEDLNTLNQWTQTWKITINPSTAN